MSREAMLKKLHYISCHRGCKESDLVFSQFAVRHLPTLNDKEIETYTALLQEDDLDIWDWLHEKKPLPRSEYAPLIAKLKDYQPPV